MVVLITESEKMNRNQSHGRGGINTVIELSELRLIKQGSCPHSPSMPRRISKIRYESGILHAHNPTYLHFLFNMQLSFSLLLADLHPRWTTYVASHCGGFCNTTR